jgi:phenol 2-monooxygenase
MATQPQSSQVDVLIVGPCPAGLMLASWFSRTGVKTRIVANRGTKVRYLRLNRQVVLISSYQIFNSQADGMQSRTLKIFDSFGFGHLPILYLVTLFLYLGE